MNFQEQVIHFFVQSLFSDWIEKQIFSKMNTTN
jgi:hypothetical protein